MVLKTWLLFVVFLLSSATAYAVQFEFPGTQAADFPYNQTEFHTEVNKTFTFTCIAKNDLSKPTLSILLKNVTTQPELFNNTDKLEDDNTFTVSVTAQMNATEDIDLKALVCVATMPDGNKTESHDVIIQLFYPPYVRSYSYDFHSTIRTITCSTGSRPQADIVWRIDGLVQSTLGNINITSEVKMIDKYRIDVTSTMVFKNATKTDNNKNVTCEYIFRGAIYETDKFHLNIPFPPTEATLTTPEMPITVASPVNVSLVCSTDSTIGNSDRKNNTTQLGFKWYIVKPFATEQTILPTTDNVQYLEPGEYNGDIIKERATVTLTREHERASLSCAVEKLGEVILKSEEVILELNYPPKIIRPVNRDHFTYFGSDFRLPCIVDSKPSSNVTWSNNNGQLLNYTSMGSGDNYAILLITDVKQTDLAEHVCRADNGIGQEATQGVMIHAESKPPLPVTIKTPTRAVNGTVTLTVEARSNTYVEFTYFVQYKESNNSLWFQMRDPLPDSLYQLPAFPVTVVLPELEPTKSYNIRVRAVDSFGRETYSDAFRLDGEPIQPPVPTESDTYSYEEYRDAILISVLVTAGGFLIIIIIIIIVMKRKSCSGSSKYDMN